MYGFRDFRLTPLSFAIGSEYMDQLIRCDDAVEELQLRLSQLELEVERMPAAPYGKALKEVSKLIEQNEGLSQMVKDLAQEVQRLRSLVVPPETPEKVEVSSMIEGAL